MTASIQLRNLAGDLRELPHSSMIAAAKAVKKIAAEEATKAGSPLSKGRRSIRLRAIDDVWSQGDVVRCLVKGVPVGPWVWVNTGVRPHTIPKSRKRSSKKPKYIRLPGHPVKAPPVVIHHPGRSGVGAWRRVQKRAQDVVPEIFRDDIHRALGG